MGSTFTVPLAAIAAGAAAAVSLEDHPRFSRHARISEAVVVNDSDAILSLPNIPGGPLVDPGDRPDVDVGGRTLQVVATDVAVNAGEVRVTITVEDECCGL